MLLLNFLNFLKTQLIHHVRFKTFEAVERVFLSILKFI